MNPQHRYRDIVMASMDTEAEHRNDFFNGTCNINNHTEREASTELSVPYNAEYSDKERFETLYNDYNDPGIIETVPNHDDHTTCHNSEHTEICEISTTSVWVNYASLTTLPNILRSRSQIGSHFHVSLYAIQSHTEGGVLQIQDRYSWNICKTSKAIFWVFTNGPEHQVYHFAAPSLQLRQGFIMAATETLQNGFNDIKYLYLWRSITDFTPCIYTLLIP